MDVIETSRIKPRFDATAKVTGQEKYAADHYEDRILWVGVKRAGVPHGRIQRIETTEAASVDGVHAILTAKHVPGTNRQGIVHKDQPVLCDEIVRHCGDAIALVIARDQAVLKETLSKVHVEIDPLPAVFDVEEALKPDAPPVHDNGNLLLKASVVSGNLGEARHECDVVVEGVFEVPSQQHAFLETENGLAWQEPDGSIVLIVSTQAPFRDRFEIGHALGLPVGRIRVISPYLGGGFGGKDGATVQCLLALAALHSGGRKVKMWWDREESFIAGYKRHAARMNYKIGAKRDGTLHTLECQLFYNTGAYAHLGCEVMELGMEHAGGPYRIPHAQIDGWCVYTNNPIAGAMRGFGVCQVNFAIERMMDKLAEALAIDPIELRLKNAFRLGDRSYTGVTHVHSTGIVSCLETIQCHPAWKQRERFKSAAAPFKRRGTGIACSFNAMGYGRGLPDSAIAKIELTPEGRFRVYSGVSDMGQGNASTYIQMAGDLLRQEVSQFELVQPDTDCSLPSGSSSASRTTYTYGNALIRACREMENKLLHRAALMLMCDEEKGLVLLPGRVVHLPTQREIPLKILAGVLPREDRICTHQFVMTVSQDHPNTGKDFQIGFPHVIFSYAAHLVEIEVDELTGKMEILRYVVAADGGNIINLSCFEQQIQGAVAQGIGYAIMEEIQLREGRATNPSFTDYLIPTSLDLPHITVYSCGDFESTGPWGMKGIGEVAMNGPLPAIARALQDAAGVWINRAPLSPARVLAAINQDG